MRRLIPIWLVFFSTFLLAREATAFKPAGHEAIEGLAYSRMLKSGAHSVCGNADHVVTGREILRFLISVGVLEAPPCFAVRADSMDARTCEEIGRAKDTWPVLGSGRPDDLYARQLGKEGQCFHFMAEPSDVYDDPTDPTTGLSRDMSHEAPKRCVATLTTLWHELLQNPEGSRRVDRGMYTLIHAVEDSYSAAHVERDASWEIQYLKVWDLVTFPYLVHSANRGIFGTQRQHLIFEERDDAWRSGERSPDLCPADARPLELAQHTACFSPRGLMASYAVEELLETTYCAFRDSPVPRMWGSRGPHASLTPLARVQWIKFISTYFKSADKKEPFDPQRELPASQRERTPQLLIGARARMNLESRVSGNASLVFDGFPLLRDTYPFVPYLGIEPGLRGTRENGRLDRSAGFLMEAGGLLPLSSKVALGLSPMALENYWHFDRGGERDTSLTASIRLDAFFHDGLWISLSSPRFNWLDSSFRLDPSLALGYAWDWGSAGAGATPGYRDDGTDWKPRAIVHESLPTPVTGTFGGGAQLGPASGYGIRLVLPEITVASPNHRWVEYGGAVLAQSEFRKEPVIGTAKERKLTSSAGLAARLRFWPWSQRIFGIGLTPIQADLGDSNSLSNVYWDLQSNLQAFLRLGAFEIAVDSPTYYWHDERPEAWRPKQRAGDMFIRFAWVQTL